MSKMLFYTTDTLFMNCLEKTNLIMAFEYSKVTLRSLINDHRGDVSSINNNLNSSGNIEHFLSTMIEALSWLNEYRGRLG